jgi:hypothetical protein
MAAAISWVALLRKVGAGPRQSVPTAIVAVALISVTILVESRLPT